MVDNRSDLLADPNSHAQGQTKTGAGEGGRDSWKMAGVGGLKRTWMEQVEEGGATFSPAPSPMWDQRQTGSAEGEGSACGDRRAIFT